MRTSNAIVSLLAVFLFAGVAAEAQAYKHGLSEAQIRTIVKKYAPRANVERVLRAMGDHIRYCPNAKNFCRMIGGERVMQRISAQAWGMMQQGRPKAAIRAQIGRSFEQAALASVQRQIKLAAAAKGSRAGGWWLTCPQQTAGNQRLRLCSAGHVGNVTVTIPFINLALDIYYQIGVVTAVSTCQKAIFQVLNANKPCRTRGPRAWGPKRYPTLRASAFGQNSTANNAWIRAKTFYKISFNQPPNCFTVSGIKWTPSVSKAVQLCP